MHIAPLDLYMFSASAASFTGHERRYLARRAKLRALSACFAQKKRMKDARPQRSDVQARSSASAGVA